MQGTRQAARQRRRRRGLMMGTTAMLIAAGLLVCLVVAMKPDRKADEGQARATSVAEYKGTAAPTSPGRKPSTPSPSAASPSVSTSAPATPTTSASASPARSPARPRTGPATPSLAGRIRPKTTYRGVATVYRAGVGDGACSYGPSGDMMIAAMNTTDYETSRACGAYVLVRTASGASVTVRITNECPLPCAPGQLDLSEQAFAELAPVSTGGSRSPGACSAPTRRARSRSATRTDPVPTGAASRQSATATPLLGSRSAPAVAGANWRAPTTTTSFPRRKRMRRCDQAHRHLRRTTDRQRDRAAA